MANQKICCESGKVRVSYKIPQTTYCKESYDIVVRYRSTFNDQVEPPSLRGVSQTVDIEYPVTVTSPFKINFYESGTNRLVGENFYSKSGTGTIYFKAKSLDIAFDNYPNYFTGGNYLINNSWEVIATRTDGTSPEIDLAQCGSFGSYTGCSYPDRWEYFDVETAKFNTRDIVETVLNWLDTLDQIRLLDPFDPLIKELELIAEGIKRFSLLRTCVIAGEQIFDSNQLNIATGLEIGVLENITLPFVNLDLQLDFWQPVTGFDQIIKTIQSPDGCPPPLIKLECCPETGCEEKCPEGTCEVSCGDFICCYDKSGKSVKTISK